LSNILAALRETNAVFTLERMNEVEKAGEIADDTKKLRER
jgi:hypothetical protein